jgi:subtilisin family serine protease
MTKNKDKVSKPQAQPSAPPPPSESLKPQADSGDNADIADNADVVERFVDMPSEPASKKQAVGARKLHYLITTQIVEGLAPLAADVVEDSIKSLPDVELIKTMAPRGLAQVLSAGVLGPPKVMVARMTEQRFEALKQTAPPQVILEEDHPLRYVAADDVLLRPLDFAALTPAGQGTPVTIEVVGVNNTPVAQASVYLLGNGFPSQGVTDQNGNVTLTVFGGALDTVRALYVKPQAGYWTLYLNAPELIAGQVNVVNLRPLAESFPNFPQQQAIGWGQKLMNLDKLPVGFTGKGIRVAVVDSGAATTHPLLGRIVEGLDITNNSPVSWKVDTVFHGSHCAGVIGGRAAEQIGIRSFAPEAELHVCKIFPGGRFSDLVGAVDYCIEHQIDIVNLSLGSDQVSETLQQKLLQAKQLGIACIVAAGNSGGPVQFPAASQHVLAVAAVGKLGEFPEDSYHSQTILGDRRLVGNDGIFSAKFSCFGPQIGVAGPGVAILSSVPPQDYAAWDGTSMAAPHITGMAALVLAHHPDFQSTFAARNAARVERLFQILKGSARPLNLGDPNRTGAGIPDALRAFPGLAPAAVSQPGSRDDLLRQLAAMLQQGSPVHVSVDQLRDGLKQAGIFMRSQTAAGPGNGLRQQSAGIFQPASVAAVAEPPTTTLSQLKQQLQGLNLL